VRLNIIPRSPSLISALHAKLLRTKSPLSCTGIFTNFIVSFNFNINAVYYPRHYIVSLVSVLAMRTSMFSWNCSEKCLTDMAILIAYLIGAYEFSWTKFFNPKLWFIRCPKKLCTSVSHSLVHIFCKFVLRFSTLFFWGRLFKGGLVLTLG
jgi:hypothetical protein